MKKAMNCVECQKLIDLPQLRLVLAHFDAGYARSAYTGEYAQEPESRIASEDGQRVEEEYSHHDEPYCRPPATSATISTAEAPSACRPGSPEAETTAT